jgi:hypothetical protein
LKLSFEDSKDNDFNDFQVKVKVDPGSIASTPEPASLIGIGMVGAALAVARRRQARV